MSQKRLTSFVDKEGVIHASPVSVIEERRSFLQLDGESTNGQVRDATGGKIKIGLPGTELAVFEMAFGVASDMSIPAPQEASVCTGMTYDIQGAALGADRCIEVGQLYESEGYEKPVPRALLGLKDLTPGLPDEPVTSLDTLSGVP